MHIIILCICICFTLVDMRSMLSCYLGWYVVFISYLLSYHIGYDLRAIYFLLISFICTCWPCLSWTYLLLPRLFIKVHASQGCLTSFSISLILFEVVLSSITKKGEIERASRPSIISVINDNIINATNVCFAASKIKLVHWWAFMGFLAPIDEILWLWFKGIRSKAKDKLVLSVMDVKDT